MPFDTEALEAAAQRLDADTNEALAGGVTRPELVSRIVADFRRIAGLARADHPLGWQYVDGLSHSALTEIAGNAGPTQLLVAETWHARFLATQAEAEAAEAERARRCWQASLERQQAPMREAARFTWAAKAAEPVMSALTRLDLRAAEVRRTLGAVAIGDEDAIEAALVALGETSRDIANAIGIVRRESRIRGAAAAADAAVAATLAA